MAMRPGEHLNPGFREAVKIEQERDRRRFRGRRLGPGGRWVAAAIALMAFVGGAALWVAGWGFAGVLLAVVIGTPAVVVALRG